MARTQCENWETWLGEHKNDILEENNLRLILKHSICCKNRTKEVAKYLINFSF